MSQEGFASGLDLAKGQTLGEASGLVGTEAISRETGV